MHTSNASQNMLFPCIFTKNKRARKTIKLGQNKQKRVLEFAHKRWSRVNTLGKKTIYIDAKPKAKEAVSSHIRLGPGLWSLSRLPEVFYKVVCFLFHSIVSNVCERNELWPTSLSLSHTHTHTHTRTLHISLPSHNDITLSSEVARSWIKRLSLP